MSRAARAVLLLGITQIIGYATLMYAVVLAVPQISDSFGWSRAFGLGGFSLALIVAGLASPRVGRLIQRFGGRGVMAGGSATAACGLAAMSLVDGPVSYLLVWSLLGLGMAATLYDPAFATLGSLFAGRARRLITALTLIAGFASTIGWPATLYLLETLGWRETYLVFAAVTAFVALPLHLALPRPEAVAARPDAGVPGGPLPEAGGIFPDARRRRYAFLLLALAFSSAAFQFVGLSAHLLALLGDLGMPATAAVMVGTLIGPSQVGARVLELWWARNVSPLAVGLASGGVILLAFVMLSVLGVDTLSASVFAILYGGSNGLSTIVRGTLPLYLFGADGYAVLLGRIARPVLIVGALAPFALGVAFDFAGASAALALAFAASCLSCAALAAIVVLRGHVSRVDLPSRG
ncbi:MFS transporter [Stappia stellulata]|uniref:MFS transporter n=1 Tax=Stappia stellulata TaxID=71235 RepID=UPI001CD2B058|nr:MFS transporter [Stappia stellulata]MCA1243903.1 MFS transporter [Stappia stellulata]